jgi:hypothetical protein
MAILLPRRVAVTVTHRRGVGRVPDLGEGEGAVDRCRAFTQFPDEKRKWQADLGRLSASAVRRSSAGRARCCTCGGQSPATPRSPACRCGGTRRSRCGTSPPNRDEEYFPDPYRFDIARTPNEQGAFGTGGAHFCLGSHLARREVTAMFVELFRRLPDIEATTEPERLRSNFIRGIKGLPATFSPA